jgi:DNA polymerase-1
MPIQWTSADIIKIAMIEIYDFINKNNLKSKMIMQVHDELVFDCFSWEEKLLKLEISNIMENILKNKKIKLKIDIWEWNSWKYTK